METDKKILRKRRSSRDSEERKSELLSNAIAEVNSWKGNKPEVSFISFMHLMIYAEILIKYNLNLYSINILNETS